MAENALMFEMRHSGWDVVLGLLLVVASIVMLSHVAISSVVSVLFLGWLALISGIALLAASLFRIRKPGFWQGMIGGALFLVLGIGALRNPGVGLAVLSLLAGSLFLAGGIARLASAFQGEHGRGLLIANAVLTIALGLLILFQWPMSSMWLLGALVGVQLLVDGLMMIFVGRLRPVPDSPFSAA
ncbi:MAG: DUF308 domain-containing protein [Aquisalimonadaceae bacterium]